MMDCEQPSIIANDNIRNNMPFRYSDFTGTKFQGSFEEISQERRMLLKSFGWYLLYVLLCSMIYLLWLKDDNDKFGYIDAMYFVVVTCTTVGYGDIAIKTKGQRIFTIFFILLSTCVMLSIFLTIISDTLFRIIKTTSENKKKIQKEFDNELLGRMSSTRSLLDVNEKEYNKKNDKEGEGKCDDEEKMKRSRFCDVWYAVFKNSPSLIAILIPSFLIGYFEEDEEWKDPLNIIYFSVVTATSVGYGDISPKNKWTRLFSVIYLPFCVLLMARIIGNVSGIYLQRKVQRSELDYMKNRYLSISDLSHMDQMYGDGNGKVTYDEFLTFMLVTMGKVEHNDINILRELYRKLDKDRSGELSSRDVFSLAYSASTKKSTKKMICDTDEEVDIVTDDNENV